VVRKAGTTLDEWSKLGSDLQQTQVTLHQLVARLDHLAANLEQGQGTAGKLLTDTALADQAQDILAGANQAMTGLQGIVTNLAAASRSVQSGTVHLPEITDAVAREVQDLPGLVQQTQVSMRELERLVEAVQRHWLLRKYVNKTDPPPLRPLPASEKTSRKAASSQSPKDSARH